MKKQAALTTLSGALLALTISSPASATLIMDNYIGGDDHGYGDVIGNASQFDVQSMNVELTGNMLSVSINTNFAGRGDDGLFAGYTYGNTGIGYGDLFLSSAWTPAGTEQDGYLNDSVANGTDWSYAFSLNNRWQDGGTGRLYSLAGDASDVLLSENFLSGATYRNGQEIAVDTTLAATAGDITGWSVSATSINFLIDLTGTSLEGSDTIALHWGMTCGNDTIEGEYSVPEPSIMALLSLGLIGIIGFKQRRKV